MNKILTLIFFITILLITNCSSSHFSSKTNEETIIFKEIKQSDSILDIGGVNQYKLIVIMKSNKLRYTIGKQNDCSNLSCEIDLKSNFTFKHDSIFFKLNRKYKNGIILTYKFNGVIKNDSLILNRYIKDALNDYSFAETHILKKCRQ